jgi:monoamine oxidase
MKPTRRELLLGALAALAACSDATLQATPPTFPLRYDTDESLGDPDPVPTPATRVLVVGAGMSGLTVANALTTAGVPTRVFEGRDRLGGRVHSIAVGAAAVDVGASWIHEPEGNPLRRLAKAVGVLTPDFTIENIISGGKLFQTRDGFVGPIDTLATLNDLQGIDFDTLVGDHPDASAADIVALALQPFDDPLEQARLRRILSVVLQTENAAGLARLSGQAITVGNPYAGGDDLLDGHYGRLVELLSHGVDVQRGAAVVEVGHDAYGAWVQLADGTVERGSHVVVTAPLGVLKSGAVRFVPVLPEDKRGVIGRLGFGRFEKLVLQFDRKFWGDMGTALLPDSQDALPAFIDWTAHAGAPTLVVLSAGEYGERFGEQTTGALAAQAMAVLRAAFGAQVPGPVAELSTAWAQEPFTRGAYSYLAQGATLDDYDLLAAPVGDRVLFAGEATCRQRPATVDGAFSSGVREARRLLGQKSVTLTLG